MSRLLKIARREYVAFVRTVGFWLSMALMPLGVGVSIGAPAMMERNAPIPRLAVIDLTGRGYEVDVAAALRTARRAERPVARLTRFDIGPTADAAEAGRRLRAIMEQPPGPRRLDAAAVLHGPPDALQVDLWSRQFSDGSIAGVLRQALAARMRADTLTAAGVPAAQIRSLEQLRPKLTNFSPRAESGRVEMRDRLPGVVGFVLGLMLWAMILSGAGILLNSVIEEKSSRILELLLASASPTEIMGGKILGVAGVTATVMAVWIAIGAAALSVNSPGTLRDVAEVILDKGLIAYFAVYLAGGYLMYAALFTAVGAFCETTREAQTMMTPVMVLMAMPLVFMGQAISQPDMPALAVLSWFPLFTPFLMPARAAADAPFWQMAGGAFLVAATAATSLWLSARAFRAGALSGGKLDPKTFFSHFFRAARD